MATEEELQSWRRQSPFQAMMDIELVSAADGVAEMRLPYSADRENMKGNVHGGAIASIVDMVMGHAGRSASKELIALSTITLNVTYIAPGNSDLTAIGRCTKLARSICFAEAEVRDADGTLCATATATLKVLTSRR